MRPLRPYKVAIIAPTCFYYQVPLFRALSANDRIDLTVYFCSDEGSSGKDVKSVYGNDQWGVEGQLLDGYRSKFLKNHAPWGSYLKSLTGLANFGVWKELRMDRPDAVVIMSWMNPTWWLAFIACMRFDIPLFLMTDANVNAENLKSAWKALVKRFVLGKFFFPFTSGFLCAGTSNRRLYEFYGVPVRKLFPFVYSWGYSPVRTEAKRLLNRKMALRTKHNLPLDAIIVLYCGRFSAEKGSVELINAFKMVPQSNKALVLVGNGVLMGQMKALLDPEDLESVYFMGFQNRNEIDEFYELADILVLPSRKETWGMVVNEGLCFSLPVIVSDQVGSGADLVVNGLNGYVFPSANVEALSAAIAKFIDLPEKERREMGEQSLHLITKWLDRDLARLFFEYCNSITVERRGIVRGLFLGLYRAIPEWIASSIGFSLIGTLWALSTIFLFFRPLLRQCRLNLSQFPVRIKRVFAPRKGPGKGAG